MAPAAALLYTVVDVSLSKNPLLFWALTCNNGLTEAQSCFDSITVVIKSVNKRRNSRKNIL